MPQTQITLDPELHRRARRRASELGLSFAEYIRRLISLDLEESRISGDPSVVFCLGSSANSDVARHKDSMIGEAAVVEQSRKKP